jgi:hypothetical protein
MTTPPGLFGLKNSNRDFAQNTNWGKNQFNNAFPVSLACYMSSKNIDPVYLTLNPELKVLHGKIKVSDVFGIDPLAADSFYAFESIYTPYETLVVGNLPRIDLVASEIKNSLNYPLRPLEIKLTALPDNQTFNATEDNYGSEIVIRPDTIVYLALSLASSYINEKHLLLKHLQPLADAVSDWKSTKAVTPYIGLICSALDDIVSEKIELQKPLVIQPIWKTQGKKLLLADNCLDMFIWSDFAFTRTFIDIARISSNPESISRPTRCAVWLAKMLYDFASEGKIKHQQVIDEITFDTKNDKAFAIGGAVTRKYMKSPELTNPRIKKQELKNIILGGGEKLLSPERRFDAALLSTPSLFDNL